MSDQSINLRIYTEAEETRRTLHEVDERLVKLREGATLTGRQFTQQMRLAAESTTRLRSNIQATDAAQERYRKRINELTHAKQQLDAAHEKGNISAQVYKQRIDEATKALGTYKDRLKESQVEKQKYQAQLKTVEQNTRQLTAAKQRLTASSGRLGQAFGRVRGMANQLAGVFGFGLGLYGLFRLFRNATSTIIAFDDKLRALQAITGATGRELDTLSRQAIQLGGATKYGATGVAEMQTQLAKMGFATHEINEMSKAITQLATAAHEDLEPATEVAASIIRSFQMDARDTTEVVDTMAMSFTQSALDLSAFRESVKYIAPIAKQANFTLQDTSAILATLADRGIKGSLAGTAMRGVISELSDGSSELSRRLGFAVNDFDGFVDGLIQAKEGGMELEDVFQVMDRRASSVFAVLLDGAGDLRELRNQLNAAGGAAERMANVQMQAISYQSKQAGAAWSSFILAMDKGDGLMSRMIRSTLGRFSNIMEDITRSINTQTNEMRAEINILENLNSALQNTNNTLEQKREILDRIKGEYPEMFANMDTEIEKWEEIAGVIGTALNRKRAYLELEFITEDIEDEQVSLSRLEEQIRKLPRPLQAIRGTQEFADALEWANKKMDEQTTGYTHARKESMKIPGLEGVTIKDVQALEKLEAQIAKTEQKISDYKGEQKDMAKEKLEPVDAAAFIVEEDLLHEFSDKYLRMLEENTEAAVEAGKEREKAYRDEADNILEMLDEELQKKRETINRKKQLEQELTSVMNQPIDERVDHDVWMKRHEEIKRITKEIEEQDDLIEEQKNRKTDLLVAEQKIKGVISDRLDALARELRAAEDLLRLQQKLEELEARKLYSGIQLENELLDIRNRYRAAQADLLRDKDKEYDLTLKINEAEGDLEARDISLSKLEQELSLRQQVLDLEIKQAEQAMDRQRAEGVTDTEQQAPDMSARMLALDSEMKLEQEYYKSRVKLRTKDYQESVDMIQKQLNHEHVSKEKQEELERELQELKSDHEHDLFNLRREYVEKTHQIEKARFDERVRQMETELELAEKRAEITRDQAMRDAERVNNLWEAIDFFGTRQQELNRLEKAHEIEMREEERDRIKSLEKELELRKKNLQEEVAEKPADQQRISKEIEEINDELNLLGVEREGLESLIEDLNNPGLDASEWDEFLSSMKNVASEVSNIYQGMLDERHRIAREERAILDRRISELQSDLDLQLRLNEQGFSSDVQITVAKIAKEKELRDQALEDEKRAAEEKRRMEMIIQGVNLLTAVTEVIKSEAWKGLPGIAKAAVAAGAIYGIYRTFKAQTEQATKYEKGGSFMLEGASHSQGGVQIAPGHEGQGGEMVSVFSRPVTRKYGSEIKSMTEMFNKGKVPEQSNEFDTSDIKAIRKILEQDQTTYTSTHKIVKQGNITRKCRLN